MISDLCSKCGKIGSFRPRHKQCQECEKAYNRERYQKQKEKWAAYRESHREEYRHKNLVIRHRRKAERHLAIDQLKSVPCTDCKQVYSPWVMDFDHRDPNTKVQNINFLLHKTSSPWSRILTEIAKCDVVCVNCHRLRTWIPPKALGTKEKFRQSLKNTPCADCGKTFHYCQMDFDHVRGEKIKPVSRCTSKGSILQEALKCDVICANCHRNRTQKKLNILRVTPDASEMFWEQRTKGPQTEFRSPNKRPVRKQFWHDLVGTMPDSRIAKMAGRSRSLISMYRRKLGLSSFKENVNVT